MIYVYLCKNIKNLQEMEQNTTFFTQTLPSTRRIITPIRLINTISRKEILTDALWDTGAEVSCIHPLTAEYLQLPVSRANNSVKGIGGRVSGRALLTIAMPGNCGQATIIDAFESDQLPEDVEFVIGMDIISQGNFSLTVEGGKMTLNFAFGPSFIHLDI